MILTKDQIQDIQAVLAGTENGVSVYEQGKTQDDQGWYITKDSVSKHGKMLKSDDYESWDHDIDLDDFIEETKGLNLTALYAPARIAETDYEFTDWVQLAKYLGISEMVTLGVKIPSVIARRFKYFATSESDVSTKLRELILEYVRTKWQEKAEQLIYEEMI